jgi:glycosyltransferase involved in cell wall biosynthesis
LPPLIPHVHNHVNQRPRITFVEEFYYPEGWGGAQIPRDITADLAISGYDVTVVCGEDQYLFVDGDAALDPRTVGVGIRYVPRSRFSDGNRKGVLAQLWFCAASMWRIDCWRRPSLFICQTNPPLMIIALALVACVLGRPLIIIAQDIYPEVMVAHGMLRNRSVTGTLLGILFRWAYKRAARVVSLGPKMTNRLRAKGVSAARICEISNWATGDLSVARGSANSLLREWGLSANFVLLYSGNLGVAHDSETVLRAVAAAKIHLPQLRLVLIGKGALIEQAMEMAQSLGISEYVQCRSPVHLDLLPQTLGIADLALVTLLPGFEGLVVPSKLLGHMARGIPTLYVGPKDSDVAEVISRSSGGIVVGNGEVEILATRLVALASDREQLRRMGDSAARFYTENLAREIGLSRYRSVVKDVLDGRHRS